MCTPSRAVLQLVPRVAQGLVLTFLVLALFVTPLSFSPTIVNGTTESIGQTPIFRAMLLAGLVATGALLAVLTARPWPEPLARGSRIRAWNLSLGLLITWLCVSTPFGNLAPVVPGIGTTFRMDGNLVQAAWFALSFITYLVVRGSAPRDKVVMGLAIAAAVVTSIWTYLQGIGHDPLTYLTGLYLDVPAGAFGHGALAGAFLAFVALLAAWRWTWMDRTTLLQWLVFVVIGAGISAAGGRSALAGLLVGLMLSIALLVGRKKSILKLTVCVTALVGGFVVGLLTVPRAQIQADNTVAAVAGQDAALNARFSAWKGGARLLAKNPLFGVGPGGFGYGVWPLLSAEEAEIMIRDPLGAQLDGVDLAEGSYVISGNVIATTDSSGKLLVSALGWDKAHNYLLDLGLTAGVPALAFFLLFLFGSMWSLWTSGSLFARGTAIALVSYVVFGLGWFPTISLDPVIWTLVGAALAYAELSREKWSAQGTPDQTSGDHGREGRRPPTPRDRRAISAASKALGEPPSGS